MAGVPMPAAAASSMASAMNTEQCWPSDTPPSAARASAPSAATPGRPSRRRPCSSMKEPVPALQASFMRRLHHPAADQAHVLGVLATDLEDRVHPRVEAQCPLGVGGDLVLDQHATRAAAASEQGAQRPRGRCRSRRPPPPPRAPGTGEQLADQALGGAQRIAGSGRVAVPDERAVCGVDGDGLGAGGARRRGPARAAPLAARRARAGAARAFGGRRPGPPPAAAGGRDADRSRWSNARCAGARSRPARRSPAPRRRWRRPR